MASVLANGYIAIWREMTPEELQKLAQARGAPVSRGVAIFDLLSPEAVLSSQLSDIAAGHG